MDFVSIRIITGEITRLVEFYEKATGITADWSTEDFAELKTPSATLAIGSTRTVPLFAPGSSHPAEPQRDHRVPSRRRGPRTPESD